MKSANHNLKLIEASRISYVNRTRKALSRMTLKELAALRLQMVDQYLICYTAEVINWIAEEVKTRELHVR